MENERKVLLVGNLNQFKLTATTFKMYQKIWKEGREIQNTNDKGNYLKIWGDKIFEMKSSNIYMRQNKVKKYIEWESRIYEDNYTWMCKMKVKQYEMGTDMKRQLT